MFIFHINNLLDIGAECYRKDKKLLTPYTIWFCDTLTSKNEKRKEQIRNSFFNGQPIDMVMYFF